MKTQKPKPFSMVPIKRTDVFQTIVERISELISKHLNVGDSLPAERELSENLGVSRTSVRQALKALEAMGKVETRVGSGTYVINANQTNQMSILGDIQVTKDFIRQLIVARAGIERTIFEQCSANIDSKGIEELEVLLQENQKDIELESDTEFASLDLSFEAKVAEITQNQILIKLQQQIHQLWTQAWRDFGYVPEKKELLHSEHIEILEALKTHNTSLVVELVMQHVNKEIE